MSDLENEVENGEGKEVSTGSPSGDSKEGSTESKSRSRSRSSSHTRKRSYSRSRSRSHSRSHRRHRKHHYSRSRSKSPDYRRSRSRSHSRSRGHNRKRNHRSRSHSRSPMSGRRRHVGNRENPTTSRCIGVFGLSLYTREDELRELFGKYGPLEEVQIVYDTQSGRSRGFAFVYFERDDDAMAAKEACAGQEVDGRRIRVDFSITKRAHTPTPGIYMGKPTYRRSGHRDSGRSPSPHYRGGGPSRRYSRSRSRSFSPPRRYRY